LAYPKDDLTVAEKLLDDELTAAYLWLWIRLSKDC
jgi:hypothetical protein